MIRYWKLAFNQETILEFLWKAPVHFQSCLYLFKPAFYSRAIFNWVSKVIRDCIDFALLRSVIGLEISCHFFNQSDAKLKPIVPWSLAFSRALRRLLVFALSSHWLLGIFPLFWLAVVITLVLVLRHSIEKRSINPFLFFKFGLFEVRGFGPLHYNRLHILG